MVTEIKRRNVDPDIEPISILGNNMKISVDPDFQTDLGGKPELNLKPTLNETEDEGLVGKLKLSVLPSFMKKPNMGLMGKIKLNTDFTELPDKSNNEQVADEPVVEFIDNEPGTSTPLSPKKFGAERANEQSISSVSNAQVICDADPSDAEPNSVEPVAGEDIPDEPTSNTPTAAKIIGLPAADEPADEISNDSDDPDGEDDNRRRMSPRKRRILCSFFTFWGINAAICFMIYGLLFPGVYRAIVEPQPNHHPLLLIPREKWSVRHEDLSVDRTTFTAKRVTVVQTDTKECVDFEECLKLLLDLERDEMLPYNFVIAKSGDIFEACGWNKASPMFPEMPTMVVAFIGDYNEKEPSVAQLTQLKNLLSTSEHIEYLDRSYKINGRKIKNLPTKLFQMMKVWKKYDYTNSDSEYVSLDYDPEVLDKD